MSGTLCSFIAKQLIIDYKDSIRFTFHTSANDEINSIGRNDNIFSQQKLFAPIFTLAKEIYHPVKLRKSPKAKNKLLPPKPVYIYYNGLWGILINVHAMGGIVLNFFNATHKMQLIMVIRNISKYSYLISIFG